jgi:hypothetical protein
LQSLSPTIGVKFSFWWDNLINKNRKEEIYFA